MAALACLAVTACSPHVREQATASGAAVQVAASQAAPAAGTVELVVPDIDLEVLVVEGTGAEELKGAVGHYAGTAAPGEPGNVGIAGHRTTFGHPFERLDELHPGSVALLETPTASYTYTAVTAAAFDGANPRVVRPADVSVLDQGDAHDEVAGTLTHQWLTLTTCTPKGSAAQRLVVRLQLTAAEPVAGATLPEHTRVGDTLPVGVRSLSYGDDGADLPRD